jgi:hypothetical protein
MFCSKAHRFLNAMTGLFFIVLAGLLVVLAAQIQIHDGNYAAFYLGLGVWLECVYLAVHFGLEAILITRARLAERISQVLAVLLMVPLGLIILILAVLFEQSIRTSVNYEPEVRITAWVFASLVVLLLVVPAVLICRNVVFSFLQRRAEQALGADSPVSSPYR